MTHRSADASRDAILDAWRCAIAQSGAIYLGGPITTGLRYVAGVKGDPQAPDWRERIIAENIAELQSAAQALRRRRHKAVVEPGSLQVAGWSQTDYYALWQTFIERHASLVVFVPHWEYSAGSAR